MTGTPRFLTVDQVVLVQELMIRQYGGTYGVKDLGLVSQCTFAPQATWGGEFLYRNLPEMASAYWYSFTMGHAFVDGNKRIGLATAQIFLELNDYDLGIPVRQAVEITVKIASSIMSREEVCEVVRASIRPL